MQIVDSAAEGAKIEELVDKVVQEELPAAKKAAENNRGLPAKYLLGQFFDSFKEYRGLAQRFETADLESLVKAVNEVRCIIIHLASA